MGVARRAALATQFLATLDRMVGLAHVRTLAVDAADVSTTEFNLSAARQELLIGNGRKAAKEFLGAFWLEDYMNTFHATLAPAPVAAPTA